MMLAKLRIVTAKMNVPPTRANFILAPCFSACKVFYPVVVFLKECDQVGLASAHRKFIFEI